MWFPWQALIRKIATAQGFLDPIAFYAKLQQFAQPSEVAAPIELIRLATVLQARGLLNVQAIQHNLDWIWPYWVVQQFNPQSGSFIPRAFSLTHINLTHRNWTAVGVPGGIELSLVDPRGLLTPLYDGWSLDCWILDKNGKSLIPSRLQNIKQELILKDPLRVDTSACENGLSLLTKAYAVFENETQICHWEIEAQASEEAWLIVSLRPCNPEGISAVHEVECLENQPGWKVEKKTAIQFDQNPEAYWSSTYLEGDVFFKVQKALDQSLPGETKPKVFCRAGMVTAAAIFKMSQKARKVKVSIPLTSQTAPSFSLWEQRLNHVTQIQLPNPKMQFLYEAAVRSILLHVVGTDVYPGPYTYRRFWFRDAAFILHALLEAHLFEPVEKILDSFGDRQTLTGHFRSQDGEWDSNGQVLWLLQRYCELSGKEPKPEWKNSIHKGAQWIIRKRLPNEPKNERAGLLPSGFSAEHLGPNDFYYWDDFWGVAGLRSAAKLMRTYGEKDKAEEYEAEGDHFLICIEESLRLSEKRLGTKAMPSSPYRRIDTGSIGSLAAGYPLQLWPSSDPRLLETTEYLLNRHFIHGGFFHEMSHSGINPYLTLSIAQILLRAGDVRFLSLIESIADLASPTGQWPEAIHPQTLGGCMGDGQHIWAAAEWMLIVRNLFVREENNKLVLGAGLLSEWFKEKNGEMKMINAPTSFGLITFKAIKRSDQLEIEWSAQWRAQPAALELAMPGLTVMPLTGNSGKISIPLPVRDYPTKDRKFPL